MKYIYFDFFNTLFTRPNDIKLESVVSEIEGVFRKEDISLIEEIWWETYCELERKSKLTNEEFSMMDMSGLMFNRLPIYSITAYNELIKAYMDIWESKVEIYSDTYECLELLRRDFSLGIISNTHDEQLIPNILEKYDIFSFFSSIILSVNIGYRKPSKKIFEEALKVKHKEPLIFVGDNFEEDVKGALISGIMPVYICRNTIHHNKSYEYLLIHNLNELKNILDKFYYK